jgi:hypothetical protein
VGYAQRICNRLDIRRYFASCPTGLLNRLRLIDEPPSRFPSRTEAPSGDVPLLDSQLSFFPPHKLYELELRNFHPSLPFGVSVGLGNNLGEDSVLDPTAACLRKAPRGTLLSWHPLSRPCLLFSEVASKRVNRVQSAGVVVAPPPSFTSMSVSNITLGATRRPLQTVLMFLAS